HDDARAMPEILPLHASPAHRTAPVGDRGLPRGAPLPTRVLGGWLAFAAPPLPNALHQAIHHVARRPESQAHRAFVHPEPAEVSGGQMDARAGRALEWIGRSANWLRE